MVPLQTILPPSIHMKDIIGTNPLNIDGTFNQPTHPESWERLRMSSEFKPDTSARAAIERRIRAQLTHSAHENWCLSLGGRNSWGDKLLLVTGSQIKALAKRENMFHSKKMQKKAPLTTRKVQKAQAPPKMNQWFEFQSYCCKSYIFSKYNTFNSDFPKMKNISPASSESSGKLRERTGVLIAT